MNKSSRPQVVIDTNVWLSGLVYGGHPGEVLKSFIEGYISVTVSEELLTELRRIIQTKFPLFIPRLGLLEAAIRQDTEIVLLGKHNLNVSRDPNDNMVIETALVGNCDYIVSGDKDLLDIGSYKGIKIISPKDFLSVI